MPGREIMSKGGNEVLGKQVTEPGEHRLPQQTYESVIQYDFVTQECVFRAKVLLTKCRRGKLI